MTQYAIRPRRSRRIANSAQIFIPHSSWTRVERASGSDAPVRPEEFWSRLGL